MFGVNIVQRREAVATEGAIAEIAIGQTEVALIGILVGSLQL